MNKEAVVVEFKMVVVWYMQHNPIMLRWIYSCIDSVTTACLTPPAWSSPGGEPSATLRGLSVLVLLYRFHHRCHQQGGWPSIAGLPVSQAR